MFRGWRLPPVFDDVRRRLEDRHGEHAGARQYIRVLQLLAEHPLERVQKALVQCHGEEWLGADWIIRRVERMRTSEPPVAIDLSDRSEAAAVKVLELVRCEWIDGRENCCLLGQPGTGKTHISTAIPGEWVILHDGVHTVNDGECLQPIFGEVMGIWQI